MTETLSPPAVHPVASAIYTPIFDALAQEWRPRINAAHLAVIEAEAAALDATGGWL